MPVGVAMLDPSSGLRRAPWRGGKGGRAALKAFALTALPFVLLEAATGVVSLATGLLSIPPMLGIGTAVDSAILVAGLAVALYGGGEGPAPPSTTAKRWHTPHRLPLPVAPLFSVRIPLWPSTAGQGVTVTDPVMYGCGSQWYTYVPASGNV